MFDPKGVPTTFELPTESLRPRDDPCFEVVIPEGNTPSHHIPGRILELDEEPISFGQEEGERGRTPIARNPGQEDLSG